MFNVYLAGFISGDQIAECTEWRKKIRSYYLTKGWDNLTFLDPLNGNERNDISADGLTSQSIPGKCLVHRDHQSVKNSDLLIVNVDTFGADRPLTGTIYELAWAWQYKIPVIILGTNPNYVNHPFIIDTASTFVETVDELIEKEYLKYFYQGQVCARY